MKVNFSYRFIILFYVLLIENAACFPNTCTIINSSFFEKNLNFKVKPAMCGYPIPRSCARISYRVPDNFIEVVREANETFFSNIPQVSAQLKTNLLEEEIILPSGLKNNGGKYFFHAHTLEVPFVWPIYNFLPCGGARKNLMCLTSMSEALGNNWKTGKKDVLQPKFLLWKASIRACMLKGAATSTTGVLPKASIGNNSCEYKNSSPKHYPPSKYDVCTGWGIHFPRTGFSLNVDQLTASLNIASRIMSIGSEVLGTVSVDPTNVWSMLYPNSSSTFREGQNLTILRTKSVNERGRLKNKIHKNYLYNTWKTVSCKVDWPKVPFYKSMIGIMKSTCKSTNYE